MSVVELKKALKAKGLTTTGKKQDLIDRLQLSMATEEEADSSNIDNDLLEDADVLLGDDNDEVEETPAPVKEAPKEPEPKKVAIKRDNAPTQIT